MKKLQRVLAIVVAIIAIVTFLINVVSGWPINRLLWACAHQVTEIHSTHGFTIENLNRVSGRGITIGDRFSWKLHIPLDARGTTTLPASEHIWVVLKDQHGGYYLQTPPIEIGSSGNWLSHNILPSSAIKQIVWLKVDGAGHAFFERKRDHNEWGKFLELPPHATELASVVLR